MSKATQNRRRGSGSCGRRCRSWSGSCRRIRIRSVATEFPTAARQRSLDVADEGVVLLLDVVRPVVVEVRAALNDEEAGADGEEETRQQNQAHDEKTSPEAAARASGDEADAGKDEDAAADRERRGDDLFAVGAEGDEGGILVLHSRADEEADGHKHQKCREDVDDDVGAVVAELLSAARVDRVVGAVGAGEVAGLEFHLFGLALIFGSAGDDGLDERVGDFFVSLGVGKFFVFTGHFFFLFFEKEKEQITEVFFFFLNEEFFEKECFCNVNFFFSVLFRK